jgi:hypothetical protein
VESENEIAAPDFVSRHPELHHYTDLTGLQGILGSNALWATHFDCLNDKTEVMLLKRPMMSALVARLHNTLKTATIGNRHTRRMLARSGKLEQEVYVFVEALFSTAFEQGPAEPLSEPYITSFCTHSSGKEYEIANGLLSQWRAYGGAERYCIVFDTAKLIELLENEFSAHYWVYMRLPEVHFAFDDVDVELLFSNLLERCEEYLVSNLGPHSQSITREAIVSFIAAAPRFKHQGFREEQEVRVIGIPHNQALVDRIRLERPDEDSRSVKAVNHRKRNDRDCPYLILFDSLERKLPIRRIIVGPSLKQTVNFSRA